MLEDLVYLSELQEIDLRIREQELAQEQYPIQLAELDEAVIKAQASVDSVQTKLDVSKKERDKVNNQILDVNAGLERSQQRLNTIKTNREYDAVHAEIEAQKNTLNTLKSRKQSLDSEIEKLQTGLDEAKTHYEQLKAENEPKINDLKKKIGTIDSKIAEIEKERETVVPKITKHNQRTYDLIRKRRKTGRALSPVHADRRTCTVCFKILEPQLYNEIRRGDKLILCQSCGSILIWGDKE